MAVFFVFPETRGLSLETVASSKSSMLPLEPLLALVINNFAEFEGDRANIVGLDPKARLEDLEKDVTKHIE